MAGIRMNGAKCKYFLTLLLIGVVFGPSRELQAAERTTWSLDGLWDFRTDPGEVGLRDGRQQAETKGKDWRTVRVPHTWQVESGLEGYRGVAWYRKTVPAAALSGSQHRVIEFDAVYRDATVWLNGEKLGEHNGSGWTPFSFSLDGLWRDEAPNEIVVRVDNRFSPAALPFEDSSDWAADGGIIRSVRLSGSAADFIVEALIDAAPDLANGTAKVTARVKVRCPECGGKGDRLAVQIVDPGGELVVRLDETVRDGMNRVETVIEKPVLWHFDHPDRYRLKVELVRSGSVLDRREESFGIRKIELHDGYFFLNGEPMRLMGVEWMPGSDPRYGMAESPDFMEAVLRDMKRLNAVVTRFHWQQDRAVFDFCDRHGILVQEEIPAWGPDTMKADLSAVQARQTREMVTAHYNHPSIFAWGLCNEIGGQGPEAHRFVQNGIALVRAIDPFRPLSWASNSLQKTPERDASGLVDFLEWNDYWESWYKGSLSDLESNLKAIARSFPGKSLLISEYGLCECNPENPSGDARRIEILRTHTDRYRASPNVAGAIFFDYNDYRTHIGDKGIGSFQQRVHGVVDLMGRRKDSWDVLRRESSPIKTIEVGPPREDKGGDFAASLVLRTRSLVNDLPAYTLRGYTLVWTVQNHLGQPIGSGKVELPDLKPGSTFTFEAHWKSADPAQRIHGEVFRPTGYSVHESEWRR